MARSMADRFASQQAAYKKKHPFTPFTPYQPPPLPSGSYDPAIDAQVGAAQRGLGDTQFDYTVNQSRAGVDYGLQQDQINLNQSRGLADAQQSFDRGNQDLNRSVDMLQRSYSQLANRQSQSIAASGLQGGAVLQAAAKRATNQAVDMQPLDTARTRLQQDYATGTGRLTQDTSNQLGALGIGFQRSQNDASTQLGRAQREGTQFGIDAEAEKAFAAAQGNYMAPGRGQAGGIPQNEHVTASGQHFQTFDRGGVRYYVNASGKVIKTKKLR